MTDPSDVGLEAFAPDSYDIETDAVAKLATHIQQSIDAQLAAAFFDGAQYVDVCEERPSQPMAPDLAYGISYIRWYRSDPPEAHEPTHPADRLDRVERYDLTSVSVEEISERIEDSPLTMDEVRDRI
jgi:hypothetical protein